MSIEDIYDDTELADVAKLFFGEDIPRIALSGNDDRFSVDVDGKRFRYDYSNPEYSVIPPEHRAGRLKKIALYDALESFTGRVMPWGALTGVRPTKLFYECVKLGSSRKTAQEIMRRVYRVSDFRAKILGDIYDAQKDKVCCSSEYCNLYVHIPYCTTRCTYCSFVSAPIAKNIRQSHTYVDLLCDEIEKSLDFLRSHGKKILSIYIGGGTPSALCDEDFDKMLSAIGNPGVEYTCEAGRPDTVTDIKADIMKSHGVTRVCVNPQTLNEKTLALIGRSHGVDDFYKAYEIVKKRGFDINCDLIAGLDGESFDDFKISFDGIKSLGPQNFTVHSLSKKNGSEIRYRDGENADAAQMLEYALNNLDNYRPYYLYRQKRQAGNLENVGFALPGTECVNNITTMEETVSVMACGAGAISKTISNGKIYRFANMRDVPLYIARYSEKLKAKLECFENNFHPAD